MFRSTSRRSRSKKPNTMFFIDELWPKTSRKRTSRRRNANTMYNII